MSMFKDCVEPNGKTHFVECLQLISGMLGKALIGNKHHVFLTSTDWALLAGEINRNYHYAFVDQNKPPTPENFKQADIGGVVFINSGIEDEDTVNAMNVEAYRRSSAPELAPTFQYKRDNFITAKH